MTPAEQVRQARADLTASVRAAHVIHRDLMRELAANEARADVAEQYAAQARFSEDWIREIDGEAPCTLS